MKLNARRRPLLCVCTLSLQYAFASFLACLCKRSGADPRGLWDAANKRQTNSRGYPQAQASYDGPHPGAHGESPLLGHRCRKLLLQVPPVIGLTQAGAPGCDDDLYADYGGGSNDDCVVFVAADSVATSAVAIQTNDGKQQQD